MSSQAQFTSVQVAGGLLPPDLLGKVIEAKDMLGMRSEDYHLAPGEGLRQAASRAWDYLTGVWQTYRREIDNLGANAPTAGITRERWLQILLRELGFGQVRPTPSGGITLGEAGEEESFPVSHRWERVPVHLLGWGTELDRRTKGVAGAAGAAPQSMVQELLNRTDEYLWAVLSNGQRLRLLRDSTSLVGSAYVEFDLEAIFDGELFSDFVLLFLLSHQSRFEVTEEQGPQSCWLEQWRDVAAEQGTRALERLRAGVEDALKTLGTGFLRHPDNAALRDKLASGQITREDYHRALLRVVYRLLFWLITEDREALLDPYADGKARDRYAQFFSATRLRELARTRRGDRHADLWQSVRLVFDGLGSEGGRPELGLLGLGGLFDPTPADSPLDAQADLGIEFPEPGIRRRNPHPAQADPSAHQRAQLPNESLLGALRALTIVHDKAAGPRRRVDFRNLGADELGSVYESLLELHPAIDAHTRTFDLQGAAGNERKLTGSYYTPTSLIQSLLDSALNPLLDEAQRSDDPAQALLNITVCDPACGSGHFLVAAARRIAKRLAGIETGEAEPSPAAMQTALRRVVGRCIHGVDVNPMAAELAKVALWLEALEPGKPMSFLDANIRVGNSLLGVTPKLLADGIPNEAFKPLEGDDKKVAQGLAKINKEQRKGQGDLFATDIVDTANTALARATAGLMTDAPDSLSDVHGQQARFADIEQQRGGKRLAADTWCAAFVQPKTTETQGDAITQATLRQADTDDGLAQHLTERVNGLVGQYGFFHWHLEFPHVFQVPDDGDVDSDTGWTGGFTCVLGNPPWDKIEFKEQEFFAVREPDIAKASTGAKRKEMIEALKDSDEPADRDLYDECAAERRRVEGTAQVLRESGRYPLAGRGRLNTYAVFAENDRTIISARGRTGVVLPTGIATDATTQYFFRDLVETASIASLYDFENRNGIFPGIDSRIKFCLFTMSGRAVQETNARFAFFALDVADLDKPDTVFSLSPEEIKLLNPNTGTLPVFRSRRDAEITLGIYRRVPVLVNENDPENGNPWGVSFMQGLFNMTSDSHLFHTREDLENAGWHLNGNIFTRGEDRMLPLYEAKMIHHYDHRWATYERDGTVRDVTIEEKHDPNFAPMPRYWVAEKEVDKRLEGKWDRNWLLGWRDICRATDERTTIASMVPRTAVGNKVPLMLADCPAEELACLQGCMSSYALDYASRQKVGGTTMNFYIYQQLPVLPPSTYREPTPWQPDVHLSNWIAARVLELDSTSTLLTDFASDLTGDGSTFTWTNERRQQIRAELDAAFFYLYGIDRNSISYVMDTFPIVKQRDEQNMGEYRTRHLVLDFYDAMSKAVETGERYHADDDGTWSAGNTTYSGR